MFRSCVLAVAASLLVASLALAEPEVNVEFHGGVPQVQLSGNYNQSRYTIWRSSAPEGPFVAVTQIDVLCLGACYVDDRTAVPGEAYWYRFDILPASGAPVSYGPYRVAIAAPLPGALAARAFPNPSHGTARIQLYQRGAADDPTLIARATLHDLQGRRVRTLWNGPLARGITAVDWDGRDDGGRTLGAGAYFLRLASPLGSTVSRIVRVR